MAQNTITLGDQLVWQRISKIWCWKQWICY